jgi:hypothetical protein
LDKSNVVIGHIQRENGVVSGVSMAPSAVDEAPVTSSIHRRAALAIAFALLASASFVHPRRALAGGIETTVAGARAVGRGGAMVGAAEGFDALRYNPARLSIGDRWSIGADAQLHFDGTCFDRDDGDGTDYPRVCNEAAPGIVPQLGFRAPLGERVGLGFGILPPPGASSLAFGDEHDGTIAVGQERVPSPARHAMATSANLAFFPTLGIGAEVHEKVRLGLSFGWGVFLLENVVFTAGLPGAGPVQDVRTALSGVDYFVPRITFAIDVEPVRGFQISSVTTWTADMHADASLFVSGANAGEGFRTRVNGVEVTQPLGFQQWVALRFAQPRWDIEIDGIFQGNGRTDEVFVDIPDDAEIPIDGTIGGMPISALPDEQVLSRGWKHQWIGRFGTDVVIVPDRFNVRTGLSYETSGVRHGYESVDNLPLRSVGIHAGLSVDVHEAVQLTVGYSRVFRPTTTVAPEDARIEQSVGVRPGGLADDHVFVNGGTYRTSLHVVAASILVRPVSSREEQP